MVVFVNGSPERGQYKKFRIRMKQKPNDIAMLKEVFTRNREEMLVLELAVMSLGGIACPIFSEYPANLLDYVLEHSGARRLAVSEEPGTLAPPYLPPLPPHKIQIIT